MKSEETGSKRQTRNTSSQAIKFGFRRTRSILMLLCNTDILAVHIAREFLGGFNRSSQHIRLYPV
jgi:hypothetical protein